MRSEYLDGMDHGRETSQLPDFTEIYSKQFERYIVDIHLAGRTGARLIQADNERDTFRQPPNDDLVFCLPQSRSFTADLDFGAGRVRLTVGLNCLGVIPPHGDSVAVVDVKHAMRFLAIPYDKLLRLAGHDSGLPEDGDFGSAHVGMAIDPEICARVTHLSQELRSGSPRGALYADSVLLHLAARLLEIKQAARTGPTPAIGGLAPWQVKRVCESMIAALDQGHEEATLAELALTVGLSTNHFCRSFARSTGLPPHRWMTERRMERATVLLTDPSLSLTDIALVLGYSSQSAFGRAFARARGMTPSARRRELCH